MDVTVTTKIVPNRVNAGRDLVKKCYAMKRPASGTAPARAVRVVDGDGNLEIVLGGDAYEDHWFGLSVFRPTPSRQSFRVSGTTCRSVGVVIRWDECYMAPSATTMNENGKGRQYAVPMRMVQRSSTLLVLESPRMSLARDALWHNGL